MRALIQRVSMAHVQVGDRVTGAIDQGLLVLLGVQKGDDRQSADRLLDKVLHYRVFSDDEGKMNLNVQQVEGGLLIVSQFTLAAETKKGLRPGFSLAADPADAEFLYDYMVSRARTQYSSAATGEFAGNMQVHLVNDGPVTFLLEV